jgi:maleate isomerase
MQPTYEQLLVVPSINTTMEPEMNLLCPEGAPFGTVRVPLPAAGLNVGNLDEYSRTTLDMVAEFQRHQPKLVVHGCTSAGLLGGMKGTRAILDSLEQLTGAPAISTASAMTDVLGEEGAHEIAVLTPYLATLNKAVEAYLDEAGFEVDVLASFECGGLDELVAVTQQQVMEKAIEIVTPRSSALLIACSQLPSVGIVEPLRKRLGIPVWSSVSATAWAASRALASQPPVAVAS